jgi:hypothetical protein
MGYYVHKASYQRILQRHLAALRRDLSPTGPA